MFQSSIIALFVRMPTSPRPLLNPHVFMPEDYTSFREFLSRFRSICGHGRASPGVNDWIPVWAAAARADASVPAGQCGGTQAQLAARASTEQYSLLASFTFMEFDAIGSNLICRARISLFGPFEALSTPGCAPSDGAGPCCAFAWRFCRCRHCSGAPRPCFG